MNTDTTPNLKPQTVYIPISMQESSPSTFVINSKIRGQIFLKHELNQICLSKEELVQYLNTFFYSGQEYERNIDRAREEDKRGNFVPIKAKHASDLINELFS